MSNQEFIKHSLEELVCGRRLNLKDNERAFSLMLNGDLSDSQVAALLIAWRCVGERKDELTAGAIMMRDRATRISIPHHLHPLTDNCGTGGDGSSSFNISTASAIVAASCGVHMAKHGNRSVSSQCGSADLLFQVGFPETLSAEQATQLLEKTGFTFFFAPGFHPSLKHIMPVRRALGIRTIFNLLGPLANPVGPDSQLLGVSDERYLRPMAESLKQLGTTRALVVRSRDGMDEISPCAMTDCVLVEANGLKTLSIDPVEYGIQARSSALAGGDAAHNANILGQLLDGDGSGAIADAVAMNAGAVLWLSGKASSIAEGIQLVRHQLKSKLAREYFTSWLAAAKAITKVANSAKLESTN